MLGISHYNLSQHYAELITKLRHECWGHVGCHLIIGHGQGQVTKVSTYLHIARNISVDAYLRHVTRVLWVLLGVESD